VGATPPEVLSDEAKAAQEDRDARISAFVQLAAAVSPPAPKGDDAAPAVANESVTVDTHHRLRICSFNACKMRLGSANKAYLEAGDDGTSGEYEGTHKGAELAQKWLTLASRMADFDVIVLQEVPGTEKVMDQKIETFASMLDIATEPGREWSAVNSQKSGKDAKVVGPGAEVHVCFVKSPVQFKAWSTLRKVGATELDYAPLQVRLHDPRFADPADRDFVVTSVHLPPSKRVEARDSQIAALLRNYSAPDTSEYRMQRPFKPSKESKAVSTHVIAGDFNTYPGHERYDMRGSGFLSKIPKNAATTSGHQNYDNVLVDTHANDRFLIGGGIMQLKDPHNAAKGEVGLSDHYPVFVEVREVQKTGKPLPAVESERVEEEPPPLEPPPLEPPPLEPPPLEPAPEAPEEPQPPLAEAPVAIWDRLSEEAKDSNPNHDLDQTKPEFADDAEEHSEALTDGDDGPALDLPRVVRDEPAEEEPTEEVVREVVEQAMDCIMKGVLDSAVAATPAEAPPAADPATEAPPSPPPPPPPPAPDTTPTTVPLEEEWYAAWRETLAQPLAETRAAEGAALPAELSTRASGTGSESGPPSPALGTMRNVLEEARSEWAAERLPEAD
jgi:endonuclease/exonuclease/phosphatase family metal-dependent hydrolase